MRENPEVAVVREVARVKGRLGCERVADLVQDLAGWHHVLHGCFHQDKIAGRVGSMPSRTFPQIVEIELLADPAHFGELDLAVLDY